MRFIYHIEDTSVYPDEAISFNGKAKVLFLKSLSIECVLALIAEPIDIYIFRARTKERTESYM